MIDSVVNWVKSGEIAIPEIQRPFVWDSALLLNSEIKHTCAIVLDY